MFAFFLVFGVVSIILSRLWRMHGLMEGCLRVASGVMALIKFSFTRTFAICWIIYNLKIYSSKACAMSSSVL